MPRPQRRTSTAGRRRSAVARATRLDPATMSGPYYTQIPANPVIDANSASKVATLAAQVHYAGLSGVVASFAAPGDPSYTIVYDADPAAQPGQTYSFAYGNRTLSAEEYEPILVPDAPYFMPQVGDYSSGTGWDGWGCIIDLARGIGWNGWRMSKNGSKWQATTSGAFPASGDFTAVLAGGGRGDGLPTIAGNVTVQEAAAAAADATNTYVIPHALAVVVPSQICDSTYRAPARSTDGTVTPTTSTVSHGSRFYLPATATTTSTNRIIRALVRTLQKYGCYVVDRSGTNGPVLIDFERFDPANPSNMVLQNSGAPASQSDPNAIAKVYFDAGLQWDYYDLSEIPWASMKLLAQWDGGSGGAGGSPFQQSITDGTQDGTANFGSFYPTGAVILGTAYGDANNRAFWRFTNVTVPRGSTITSAQLILTKRWADTGTLSVSLKGVAADNVAPFTTATAVTSAAVTAAGTTVTSTQAAWIWGDPLTVNVTTQVNAIISRAGWVAGNSLAVVAVDTGSTGSGNFETVDSQDSANGPAPKLVITYS